MQKIHNIEFLRIVGCISIILFHLFNMTNITALYPEIDLYSCLSDMTSNGQKAVDLFFIISGVFFACKLNVAQTCFEFIKHKLIRLYPLLVFAILVSFLISLTGVFEFTLYDNILNLLCLNGTGLALKMGNVGQFWYVSAMLWVFLLFFYLRKNFDKKIVNLIIALTVFFSYSFIIHANNGVINNQILTFYNIFNLGFLRALGAIGLGYFIGEFYKNNYEKIKSFKTTTTQYILISLVELFSLYFIFCNLFLYKLQYNNQIIFIIMFAICIILFLVQKGFFSIILNRVAFSYLAKYTYSFYMTHFIMLNTLKGSLWVNNKSFVYNYPALNILITLLIITILGIATYYLVEKPITKYLKNKYE